LAVAFAYLVVIPKESASAFVFVQPQRPATFRPHRVYSLSRSESLPSAAQGAIPMKRTVLTAALALAFAGTAAFAQQTAPATPDSQTPAPPMRHHGPPNPQHEAKHLSKVLNLTPDQTAKLEPILADRDQKIAALFQNQSLAPQDKHAQMKAIHQSTEQQLTGVLTPDQLQQMKAMRHGHGPHGGPHQAPPPAPPSA